MIGHPDTAILMKLGNIYKACQMAQNFSQIVLRTFLIIMQKKKIGPESGSKTHLS